MDQLESLFQGDEQISEVTGKPEPHYPSWKRNVFRLASKIKVM